LSAAFSERIGLFDLKALRKKRRRKVKKSTMPSLEVGGNVLQSEISAVQRSDGISPPYGMELAPFSSRRAIVFPFVSP
jgi:hypothetical protein